MFWPPQYCLAIFEIVLPVVLSVLMDGVSHNNIVAHGQVIPFPLKFVIKSEGTRPSRKQLRLRTVQGVLAHYAATKEKRMARKSNQIPI